MVACIAGSMLPLNRKLAQTQRELAQARRELSTMRPLPVDEVAKQFKAHASVGEMRVKAQDVRYSPKDDAYRIRYSWNEATTGRIWSSEVKLVGDGFGVYAETIQSSQFAAPLGYKNGFLVSVTSPSTLAKD